MSLNELKAIDSKIRTWLQGPPGWMIDKWSLQDQKLLISGWALPYTGDLEATSFTINGIEFDTIQHGLPSSKLGELFKHHPNSNLSTFQCSHEIRDFHSGSEYYEIAYTYAYTLSPINEWQNIYLPAREIENIQLPDADSLIRTVGHKSAERYVLYGFTVATTLEKVLKRYFRKSLSSCTSILDWGCGAGRIIQHIANHAPHSQLVGVDIDSKNISWCQENIKSAEFQTVPLQPPTAFPDESFDLVYGISVLTHLDESTQFLWLKELSRILKRGGIALLTVHGETALARSSSEKIIENTLKKGFDASRVDSSLDDYIDDSTYYRTTYHLPRYVFQEFKDYFYVVDILPVANANLQDLVVLLKNS